MSQELQPPKKFIVGITGKKRHGKDTLAAFFNKKGFVSFSFADPIKLACKEVFNFTDEQLFGDEKESLDPFWGTTPRKIFQYVGTDLFRNQIGKILPDVGEKIWIKVMENKIHGCDSKNIVISDVRFPDEVDMIKKMGGIILKVVRPSLNGTQNDTHISEDIDRLKPDYGVLNDGTLEDLNISMDWMYDWFIKDLKK
jgi:hypothetical protein